VTHHFTLVQQIRAHDFNSFMSETLIGSFIQQDLIRAISAITISLCNGDRAAIHNYVIEINLGRVTEYRIDMLLKIIAVGFPRLRHEVGNKNFRRLRGPYCISYSAHQEVGKNAGVKRTWPNRDHVGGMNRGERFGQRQTVLGRQPESADLSARCSYLRFAAHFAKCTAWI